MVRNNLIGVKFGNKFSNTVQLVPQRLLNTKKEVSLAVEPNPKEGPRGKAVLPDLAKTLQSFRPKTNMMMKVSRDGEAWLKNKLDIDINNLNEENQRKTFSEGFFLNDKRKPKPTLPKGLSDLNLPSSLLENIYFHKNVLLNLFKQRDYKNLGSLGKNEIIECFLKSEIEELDEAQVNRLLELYGRTNPIDYTKMMGYLLRDIKAFLKTSNNSKLFRKNVSQTARTGQFPTIKDSQTIPNSAQINETSQKSLERVIGEIKTIKSIFYKIKQQNYVRIDQKVSHLEFANILRQYSIAYTSAKIKEILQYLELNPDAFSMRQFEANLNSYFLTRLQGD